MSSNQSDWSHPLSHIHLEVVVFVSNKLHANDLATYFDGSKMHFQLIHAILQSHASVAQYYVLLLGCLISQSQSLYTTLQALIALSQLLISHCLTFSYLGTARWCRYRGRIGRSRGENRIFAMLQVEAPWHKSNMICYYF